MSAAEQFVTKEEFEPMKADIQKLIIRVEVLTQDVHSLRLSLAAFVEATDARFDGLENRFDHLGARVDVLETRFDKLEKMVSDGNAALMSAILNLGPRTA